MFGSSGSQSEDSGDEQRSSTEANRQAAGRMSLDNNGNASSNNGSSNNGSTQSPDAMRTEDNQSPDRRTRRSSGFAKAKDMLSGVKNSLASSPTRTTVMNEKTIQTPIQKLGKTDPALSVPQGHLNNAAGESYPGPRSTFRVGVTEDKNKKCRRTMEDTHAYLYNFLSTPAPVLDPKDSAALAQVTSETSVASNQPVVESDNGYFAIFDGHAGTFAAEWCGKKLHLLLEENIRRYPNKAIPELLDETFTTVDKELEKLPLKNSGCTAVIAVLRWEDRIPNSQSATGSTSIAPAAAAAAAAAQQEGEQPSATSQPTANNGSDVEAHLREFATRQRVLYTANVGDARIVLCRNGKALRLSYDHKGSDDNEGKRIANAGGLILNNRVNGVLAVTRALGDAYMKDLVTGHPYTTETVIQPEVDEFLILACDGLWDVCTDQEAVDLIRNVHDAQAASKILVDHALARFSTDNLSCMVIRVNSQAVADTVAQRTEPIGVEGDPPTKVAGGVTESEAIVGAARRSMEGEQGVHHSERPRLNSDMIREQEEEAKTQEPGPELDPAGLQRAREKAKEGQKEVNS